MNNLRNWVARGMRALASSAVFLTLFAAPLAARAADKAMDEVALQNGGVVKGDILVMEPGEKVVIQVPGEDQPRTIPWSEVSDVVRGDERASSDKPATKEEDAKAQRREGKGVVKLHIESEEPDVYLVEHKAVASVVTAYGTIVGVQSNTICHAPCDKVIDASPDTRYTIGGDEVSASEPFALHQYQGDVTATVDPDSPALRGIGIAATTVGGLSLLAGVPTTVLAYINPDSDPVLKPVGISLIVGGGSLLIGGIIMTALSGTDVDVEPRRSGTQARKPNYWRGEF